MAPRPETSHAATHNDASFVPHHHHVSAKSEHAVSYADPVHAADPHHVSDSHRCCNDNRPALSTSCVASRQNEWQEQTATPKFDSNSAVVQSHAPILVVMLEGVNRTFASRDLPPVPDFCSLALRI